MKDGKFEVGDRVRVVGSGDPDWFVKGDVGVIVYQPTEQALGFQIDFNGQGNANVVGDGFWLAAASDLEFIESAKPVIQPAAQPSKPTRVRAYKEDYIQRATLAEMRVHQLECELNGAVDELSNLRAAVELAAKELVRLTDQLNGQRADFLTQKTLANRYKELYDGLTVPKVEKVGIWAAIKRAFGKAVHHA